MLFEGIINAAKMYSWILLFSATEVALLLLTEYADLGKWVAAAGGGFLSGPGLPLLLFFNCSAVLWQYLAIYSCVVTGKNLAQICSEQYSRLTCVLLGTVVALSVIASDLTKILGLTHGFSMLFEMGLFSSTLLATIVAVVLPVVFSFLGSHKLKVIHLSIALFTPFFYALGVRLSQLEASSVTYNAYPGVNLKNASMLMALLGAHITPHNLYIHPYILQHQKRELNIIMRGVIQTHLFPIVFIFLNIFMVNSVIMISSASVVNNYGSLVPSLQDALLLMDQIFRNPVATFPFCLCFILSSLLSAIDHCRIRQVIARDFFFVNLPIWVHIAIAKVFAVVLALYCTLGAGSEGFYQLLLFCQIIAAILLPPSVIPLFQLSTSRLIMGAFRVSHLLEFLCMISFTGMLVTNSVFIIELLFGEMGWSVDLLESMGDEFTLYYFLVLLALASLFFTLFLFFTPVRSSVNEPHMRTCSHMRTCTRELQKEKTKQSESREENDLVEVSDNIYKNSIAKTILKSTLDCQCVCSFIKSFVGDPENNVNSGQGSDTSDLVPNPTTACISYGMKSLVDEVFSGGSDILNLLEQRAYLESNEGDMMLKRGVTPEGDQLSSSSELLESSCNPDSKVYGSKESMMTDKSVSVVIGKEATSGMSRGIKRQLAAILDEFWGLLFDYHGKLTKEAKSIRAAVLLGLDYEPLPTSTESETARKTSSPKGQKAKTDPPLPIISSTYNSSPIMLTVPSFQSPNTPVSLPSWSPVVQYRDRQPNQHGIEVPSKISISLKPQNLDSKTEVVLAAFTDDSKSKHCEDNISKPIHLILGYETFWAKNHFVPSVNFIGEDKSIYNPHETLTWGGKVIHSISGAPKKVLTYGESERLVLQSLQFCIRKLLRLDRSGWLFSQNGGPDEELIDYLAMTKGLLHEDGSTEVHDDLIIFLPNISYCSKGCVWQASLVVSFAVWCVRRILELLLVESRPEIWGKYTYVLNRLQGILDPAFCKPRKSLSPCKCLQARHYSMENSGTLRPTCRRSVLELIKEAEASTSRHKGRPGTGAGNIAFPKGKDNVTSVFRRYRRRLTN